jgi:uncharacterized protein YbjT (DUF2867 family)
MRVLIVGATGFIGARVAATLHALGHDVIGCSRRRREAFARHREHGWIGVDYACDLEPRVWRPRLYAIDAVINCAGVLRESAANTYESANALGPAALFEACERLGVRRVLHFSALGAPGPTRSHFLASKRYADAALESSGLDWTVLAPAPVFGAGAPLSRAFRALARLPVIPVADARGTRLAPVHVDDVVQAVIALLDAGAPVRTRVALVGPEAMSFPAYLSRLRRAMGLGAARFLPLPDWAATLALTGFAGREAVALARTDMTADPAPLVALLGRPPRAIGASVAASAARAPGARLPAAGHP